MKILRAYKTELDPNNEQKTALLRHAGAARWAFNFGLRRKMESYKVTGKSPAAIDLHRELNVLKKKSIEDGGVPWMYEVSKCAPQEALRNLDRAYANFFRRCKQGAKRKGFPKFKSRKRGIGSFTLTGAIRIAESLVQLPRLGDLRLKEHGYLPVDGVKILKAVWMWVSRAWRSLVTVRCLRTPRRCEVRSDGCGCCRKQSVARRKDLVIVGRRHGSSVSSIIEFPVFARTLSIKPRLR